VLRKTKEWDVRCPRALLRMFPERRGYYYKVTRRQAKRIVCVLSRAYGVPPPVIADTGPGYGVDGKRPYNGCCYFLPWRRSRIHVHARGHMKTVFHEFYHHLEHATGGRYNSDDRRGGDTSLAWQFADKLFELFRHNIVA
jgi:hypothetical protein